MLPTNEGLDAERLPGEQSDLGLVVNNHLTCGNRVPQLGGLDLQIPLHLGLPSRATPQDAGSPADKGPGRAFVSSSHVDSELLNLEWFSKFQRECDGGQRVRVWLSGVEQPVCGRLTPM
jgi:hypothetical protein